MYIQLIALYKYNVYFEFFQLIYLISKITRIKMACAYPESESSSSSVIHNRILNDNDKTENDASDIEQTELPKKRGKGLLYKLFQTFETLREALSKLKVDIDDQQWRYVQSSNTSDGIKRYYRCAASGCPVKLVYLAHCNSEKASIYIAELEHEHVREINVKLTEKVKEEIANLYKLGITRPKNIIRQLAEKDIRNISSTQISNFLQRFKCKEFGTVQVSVNELKQLC
jgi:hypothetical protein